MSFGLNAADLGADLSDLSDSELPLSSSEPIKLLHSQLSSPFTSQLQRSQLNNVLSSPLSSMSSMRFSLNAPRVAESTDFQWHFSPQKNSNAPVASSTPQNPDPNQSSSLQTSQTSVMEGRVPPSATDELLRQKISVLRQHFDALNSEHQELRHLTAALTQQHSQQQQSALAWQWQFQQAQQHIAFLMSNSSGTNDGLNEMRGRALELATAETQRLEAALLSLHQQREQERQQWSQSSIQDRATAESAVREVDRLRVEIEQLAVAFSATKKQQERQLQVDDLRAAQQVQALTDAESRAVAAERSALQWRSQFEHEQQSVLDHQANISTLQRSLTEAHARIASKEQELNATRTYQEQLGAELERTKMELIDLKQMDGGVQVSRDAEMQRLSEIHTQQLAASRRALIEMQLRAEKAESKLQQSVLQQQQQHLHQLSQQVQAEQPLSNSNGSQKRDTTPVSTQHHDIELHQAMGIFDQSEIQTFAPSSPHKTPADITTAVSPAELPRRVSDLFTSPTASPALTAVAAPALTPSLQNDSKFSPLSMSLLATPAMQPALDANPVARADIDLGSRTRLFFDDVEEHNLFHQPEEAELFDSKPSSPITVVDRGHSSLVMSAPIFSPVAPAVPLPESIKQSPSAVMSDQFSDIVHRLQHQLNTATDDLRQANQAKRIAETNCEELHDQITELQFQLKTVHHQLLQQQSMSRSLQTESRPKLEPKMTQTDADPNQDLEKLQRLSIEQLQQQKRDYEFQLEQLHHRHQLEVSSLQHAISNQEKVHSETLAQLQTQHRLAISSMQIEHNIALDQCALEQQTKARAWFESSLQRHTDTSQQQLNSSLQVAAERVRALETVISDLQSQLSSATPSASLNAVECASVEVQTELSVDKMTEPNSCNMQARGTNTDPLPEIAHPQPVTVPAKQDAFSTLLLKRAREECCQLKEANERLLASHISLRQEHDSVRQQLSALQQRQKTATPVDKVATKSNEPMLSAVSALQATPPRALSRSARLTHHSQSGRSLISSIDGSVVTESNQTTDRPQPQPVAALSPAHFRSSPLFDDSDEELSLVLSKPIVPSVAPSQQANVPARAEALPAVQPVVKSAPKSENAQRTSASFVGRAERPVSSTTSSLRDSSDSVRDRFSALRRSLQGLLPAASSSRYQHNVE